jgi:signal transduction histidine kinase
MNQIIKKSTIILTSIEKKHLKEKQVIKMCIDPNWMPFEKIHQNKHTGITAEYIQNFSKKIGTPIRLIQTNNWSQSLEYAEKRKCDILSLAMSTPKREKYMDFSIPYIKVPLVLVTKENITFITSLDALKNKTIGIQKDFAYNEIIRTKHPKINIIDVENLLKGFEKVEAGELFGQISTNISSSYLFQKKFSGSLKISGKFDHDWELGIAVRNDDPILLNIFNKAIISLNEDTKQKILNKWVSIKYEPSFNYDLFWKILFILFIIILFFIYKHILLNKHNHELKKAKKEIEGLNATLERRVTKRTKALEEKKYELETLNNNLDIKIKEEINKRKEQEQLLIQQSRLAEMGEMISMIAHQWRQPLSALGVIIQNIHLSHSVGKLDENFLSEQIKKSNALTNKMSNTINDFMDFFKPNKEKSNFSLHAAIQQTIFLIDDSFKNSNIEITRELNDDVIIYGFGNELSQVLLNILTNSKDALIGNNTIIPTINIQLKKGSNYGEILISDNAGGIDNKIIHKIFEPYFTTKEDHNGTGLGLYMSKMIIEQNMDGKITVDNTLEGARFCIHIPTNILTKN